MMRRRTRTLTAALVATACSAGGGLPDIDVQGHRGDRGNVPPGNTIPSFESAIATGVDTLEADMQISVDGEVVMGHDPDLLTTGCMWAGDGPEGSSAIALIPVAEVAEWDCHPELDGIQPPPRLERVLELDDAVAFNLELKLTDQPSVDTYMQAIINYDIGCGGCLDGRLTVQSFGWNAVEYAKQTYAEDPDNGALSFRGSILAVEAEIETIAEAAAYAEIWAPAQHAATPEMIEQVHDLGLDVVPWTVDDPDRMQALISMGVDGIITNRPDLLLQQAR